MEVKKNSLFMVFIFGVLSALLVILLYTLVPVSLYLLFQSSSLEIFLLYLVSAIRVAVWIWITISILYAFSIMIVKALKNSSILFRSYLISFLFFVLTISFIAIGLSYVPKIITKASSSNSLFYLAILSFSVTLITIQVSVTIRRSIIKVYELMTTAFGYDSTIFNEEKNYDDIDTDQEIFNGSFDNALSFSYRNKTALGVICFKISNIYQILPEYGEAAYSSLESQLVRAIKEQARGCENQCLIRDNTILSIIYADEEMAYKALRRYYKSLKLYSFEYDGVVIPFDLAIAASGVDFSNSNLVGHDDLDILRSKIVLRALDALLESEETGNFVVSY